MQYFPFKLQMTGLTFLIIAAISITSCSNSSPSVSPTTIELGPIKQRELMYIAKSPADLGASLFSYELSEQSRKDNWSNYVDEWVLWSGIVREITPQLKPSRITFVYQYNNVPQMSFQDGKFVVAIDFAPEFSGKLMQLSNGSKVYIRARVTEKETTNLFENSRYGVSNGDFLSLGNGQLLSSDSDLSRLADIAYSSYDQLEQLSRDAAIIAAIKNYYEQKLQKGTDWSWIAAKTIVEAAGVTLDNEAWLQNVSSLDAKQQLKSSLKAKIEAEFSKFLVAFHDRPSERDLDFQNMIEQKHKINNTIVYSTDEAASILKTFYEDERQMPGNNMSDAAMALILEKLSEELSTKVIGISKAMLDNAEDIGKLDAYATIVGSCYYQLGQIDKMMGAISDNVIEILRFRYRTN